MDRMTSSKNINKILLSTLMLGKYGISILKEIRISDYYVVFNFNINSFL